MAEKRMFAKSIVMSDDFLEMPTSTRCLYFTLGMFADDDGFVNNPKSIMRQISATEDDMKILIAKSYVLVFESGVIVIKHWRINNYIRGDRYHKTTHTDELNQLCVLENKEYAEKSSTSVGLPPGTPDDYQVTTESSIDESKLEEISSDKSNKPKPKQIREEFDKLWKLYPKKQGHKKALEYYQRARENGTTYEQVEEGIKAYAEYVKATKQEDKFIKHGSTFFSQESWLDEWSVPQQSKTRYQPQEEEPPMTDEEWEAIIARQEEMLKR